MPHIPIGDAELWAETHGDGPALLLIAGLGGRGAFWRAQLEPLSRHFRVTLHDHRGTGASTRSRIAYSVAQMADDTARLMDALGIARARIVGHSTGGAIGQHLAIHTPERVDRLVLSASWPGPDALFTATFAMRRQVLARCGAEAYLMGGALLGHPAEWLAGRFASAERFLAERLATLPEPAIELSRIDAVMAHDLRAGLGRITAPTLCIVAEDDQLTPPHFSREMAAAIPGAALALLPRGGHFAPQTVPELYTPPVLAFLTGAAP